MLEGLQTFGQTAFNYLYNVLTIVVGIVVVVALFFGSKFLGRWNKKRKSYVLSALILKRDGDFEFDFLGYFDHSDSIDKLHFKKKGHTMPVIPNEFIRGRKVVLFEYGPKQYAPIHPRTWAQVDLKKFNIELVNMQMKNFVFLEQRAAVSRWAYLKDLMTKLAPWITIVLVGAVACLCVWFMMKLGMNMYTQLTAARVADCSSLLPQLSVPKPLG